MDNDKQNKYGISYTFKIGSKNVTFEPSDKFINSLSKLMDKELEKKVGKEGLKAMKKAMIIANRLNE